MDLSNHYYLYGHKGVVEFQHANRRQTRIATYYHTISFFQPDMSHYNNTIDLKQIPERLTSLSFDSRPSTFAFIYSISLIKFYSSTFFIEFDPTSSSGFNFASSSGSNSASFAVLSSASFAGLCSDPPLF
jgi:hypothetical protein